MRTEGRYDLLRSNFTNNTAVSEYITSHIKRPPQYKQVYWLVIDALPIYVLRYNHQKSNFAIDTIYRTKL